MNNYLMITGMPKKAETDNTDSETAKPDPEVTDKAEDINLSYRGKHTNKRNKHKPRPIYVGFTRLSVWRKVILVRRKLKGTGLGIQ